MSRTRKEVQAFKTSGVYERRAERLEGELRVALDERDAARRDVALWRTRLARVEASLVESSSAASYWRGRYAALQEACCRTVARMRADLDELNTPLTVRAWRALRRWAASLCR